MKIHSIVQPVSHHLSPDRKLSDVAELFQNAENTALPVMNEDGTLLGLITKQDVANANTANPDNTQNNTQDTTIAALVQPVGVTCTPNDDVTSLASQVSTQPHIAVVDEQGKLVGLVDLSPYQTGTSDVEHREENLDEALDETFPASDPISPP